MIHIPIQIVSNSYEFERYIYDCVLSLRNQSGIGNKYHLTINILVYEKILEFSAQKLKTLNTEFITINLIELPLTCGYGQKQNLLWNNYTKVLEHPFDAFMTINPDILMMPDVIDRLYTTFAARGGLANIVEARQFPIENPPRLYDENTLEVNWCSGACILLSAAFFGRCEGFDETIYLYCEDVDLSWRAWLDGGQCLYCYDAVVAHMTHGLYEGRYYNHSVASHESHMALSHLILTWKYFSEDKMLLNTKMELFKNNSGIPNYVKEISLKQFDKIKPDIKYHNQRHPRIEILDYGLYSALRPNLI